MFHEVDKSILVFAHQVINELRDGLECFVILTRMKVENGVKMQSILVVSDFMDVFPYETPKLPPKREVEFSIDLLSRA